MLDLSIIIPTKDRQSILWNSLEHVLNATKNINCEIFIIDNSTTSDLILPAKLTSENLRILKNPGNRNSVFSSRNFGASISNSALLLFLDDDIVITKESIDFTIEFHKQYDKAVLNISWEYPLDLLNKINKTIFGRYTVRSGYTAMKDLADPTTWQENKLFESTGVASFFLAIKAKHFKEIGGYEERHLHEGTDVDIINRLVAHKIKMFIYAGLKVFHNEEDRLNINGWMQRRKRFGEISAFANSLGEKHELHYKKLHKPLFGIAYKTRTLLIFIIEKSPQNMRRLDLFFFKLLDLLTGAHTYHGYKSKS